jgi:Bacterial regulatory proteins, luxR family
VRRRSSARSRSVPTCLVEDFAARTDPIEPLAAVLSELTPREREVLVLVAYGLSNGEIAERLAVTEATIKSHVGSLLMTQRAGAASGSRAWLLPQPHGFEGLCAIGVADERGDLAVANREEIGRADHHRHPAALAAPLDLVTRARTRSSSSMNCSGVSRISSQVPNQRSKKRPHASRPS